VELRGGEAVEVGPVVRHGRSVARPDRAGCPR
jgi:hypothetical protein